MPLPCNKGSAKCPHNPGDIRPYGLAAGDFLKAAQNGVIVKRAALHHHMVSQIGGACDLNYLK